MKKKKRDESHSKDKKELANDLQKEISKLKNALSKRNSASRTQLRFNPAFETLSKTIILFSIFIVGILAGIAVPEMLMH